MPNKNPCPRGHAIILVDPSVDIITLASVYLIYAWGLGIFLKKKLQLIFTIFKNSTATQEPFPQSSSLCT